MKESLLLDQGFICCYCGLRIENNEFSEIEHIKPMNECTGEEKYKGLDYNNFLISCNGSTKEPRPREVHCNNFRSDRHLVITPLDTNCENIFLYTSDGIVISKDSGNNEIENLIDKVLNLNAIKIKNRREDIIEALEKDFNDSAKEEVLEEIFFLSKKNDNRFQVMCFVSVNYLKENFL